jgi:hypothetical protein
MKTRILIATNLITLALAIFLFTRNNNGATGKPAEYKLPLSKEDNPEVCVSCEDETKGEEIEHFRNVLENYRKNIWDSINNNTIFNQPTKGMNHTGLQPIYNSTDARCIWFSLETIKQFICTIEKNNARLNDPAQNLGIRFYYAVYESDYAKDPLKRNRHTLFMVPTYSNGSGAEIDFDPRATADRQNDPGFSKTYQGGKVTYVNLLNENKPGNFLMLAEGQSNPNKRSSNLVTSTTSTTSSMVKNNGEICPTNCPTLNTLSEIDQ